MHTCIYGEIANANSWGKKTFCLVTLCADRFRALVRQLLQYHRRVWPCHARSLAHGVPQLGVDDPVVLLHQGLSPCFYFILLLKCRTNKGERNVVGAKGLRGQRPRLAHGYTARQEFGLKTIVGSCGGYCREG